MPPGSNLLQDCPGDPSQYMATRFLKIDYIWFTKKE